MSAQLETLDQLPLPTNWPEFSWRPSSRADAREMHALVLAAENADGRSGAGSLEDFEREFDDPWHHPETDSLLALAPNGQAVAFARTFVNPMPENNVQGWMWVEVHPEQRGRGLEEFLLGWAEVRNRRRLALAPNGLARDLRMGYQDTQRDMIALSEQRGYRPIRYFFNMRRDLREPIPGAGLPDGLTLRTYTPDMSRALRDAVNDSFRDHWNHQPITEEEWGIFIVGRSSFRPDLTYLVLDGDQIAGFSVNRVDPAENAQQGFNAGHVQELGVRRAWRKQGIATALLCRSMHVFKAEGLDYATLGVDAQNLTGALRIYERVGFLVHKRFTHYSKPVE